MKKILFSAAILFVLFGLLLGQGCELPGTADPNDPVTPITQNGTYVFWAASDLENGKINVYLDDIYQGQIEYYYPNGINCTDNYSLTVSKAPGAYAFRAEGEAGTVWAQNVNFTSGGCQTLELTKANGTNPNNPNPNINCISSLDGTWRRLNDGPSPGTTGMIVKVTNGVGVIQSVGTNQHGFYTGQIKWKNWSAVNCSIDDLNMPDNKYYYAGVKFTGNDYFKVGGSIEYQRQ